MENQEAARRAAPSLKAKAPKPLENGRRLARGRTREEARFTPPPSLAGLPGTYIATLEEIKSHLRSARVRAVLAANPIVIESYWHTGKIILSWQQEAKWGAKVIDRLSADLRAAFPDMLGLSSRNLLAMKIFAREFPDAPIAQHPVAQLPWGHVLQILQQFLLELGAGFAFVGRQVHLEVGDRDFYLDLLFYHLKLRRYVVIELKSRTFEPGDAGQINLSRSAVDDLLRHPDDQPTISLLLCKGKTNC
ncbi:MAG: PDDEXK nuclease domain-containing protein [Terrimicrobiaceae bacterium]